MIIGFTCSCFDLFHPGHVLMLEEAKSKCDKLIVGLQTDPTIDRPEKNKPVQSLVERHLQLRACKYVDDIVVYETENDLMLLLEALPINIRIIGEEYKTKQFTGDKLHHEFYWNKRNHKYSSSELRKRIKEL